MRLTDSLDILRYADGKVEELSDLMVNEFCLLLKVNGNAIKELLCSPAELEELILGFLKTQGYIKEASDVYSIYFDESQNVMDVKIEEKTFDDSFDECKDSDYIYFDKDAIIKNLGRFYEESLLQKATAGVHRCALCDDNGILFSSDDISRHCAFDKVIGRAIKEGISLRDKYLITSGRVPLDVIKKVDTCGIPMLVSRTAPTVSAALFAREKGITLLGFSKGNRFNIYSEYSRIK